MAKQIINLGTAPTGTGGDTPRTAFQKAIDNFTELYLALGASGDPVALPAALPLSKGGTGVATIAALLAALQSAGAYGKSNIVGTVGQASGVPTGAIVETGTNANGTYTKWADGTMECTKTLVVSAAIQTAINGGFYNPTPTPVQTMPATFVAIPKVSLQMTCSSSTTGWVAGFTDATVSSWGNSYMLELFGRGTQTYTLSYRALGRWF